MSWNQQLQKFAKELGADLFGVADLARAHDAICKQGGSSLAAYPRAITVGIRLLDTFVDELPGARQDRAVAMTFKQHAYDLINARLDAITSRTSSVLQNAGHKAFPIPASQILDTQKLIGRFSHKIAAHLAGLGWIGRSCLLVTPQFGPRVRWATVLTDAPLTTGKPMAPRCGKCSKCVELCPVSAFTGRPFSEDEPRSARFDVAKCQQNFDEVEKEVGVRVCGLCVYACPHGNSKKNRPKAAARA